MEKVMNSFINEHRDAFNEHFNKYVNDKLSNREDYKEIMNKIHALYEKYPKLRAFIEDESGGREVAGSSPVIPTKRKKLITTGFEASFLFSRILFKI